MLLGDTGPWPRPAMEKGSSPSLGAQNCDLLCSLGLCVPSGGRRGCISYVNVVGRDEGREGPISSPSTASQGTGLAQLGECSW